MQASANLWEQNVPDSVSWKVCEGTVDSAWGIEPVAWIMFNNL